MFWRIEPRFERKDESGFADAMAMIGKFDQDAGRQDITSAFAHLLAMPECTGKVGAVGFCLGGTLTYVTAATARANGKGPDAAVSYYGSGIHDMLTLADNIECPIMFHYGDKDPFITQEQVAAGRSRAGGPSGRDRPPLRRGPRVLELGRAVDVRREGVRQRSLGPDDRLPDGAPAAVAVVALDTG